MIYYVYIQENETTGEYYIGKSSCNGEPENDAYIGSGVLFLNKYKACPEAFKKSIVATFDIEEEAYAMESMLVGKRFKGGEDYDGLCLNLMEGGVGGPSGATLTAILKRLWSVPTYREKLIKTRQSESFREQAREKAKRDIKMVRGNECCYAPHDQILEKLNDGWVLTAKRVWLHKENYGVINIKNCPLVIEYMNRGFVYGKNYTLEQVSLEKALQDYGLEEVSRSERLQSTRKTRSETRTIAMKKDGDTFDTPLEDITSYLNGGWDFKNNTISLYNDELELNIVAYYKSAKRLVLNEGWKPGKKTAYKQVNIRELNKAP